MSHDSIIDPKYVHISKKELAKMLDLSTTTLDKLSKTDSRFPQGWPSNTNKIPKIAFRLSDCYVYSEHLIQDGLDRGKERDKEKGKKNNQDTETNTT